MVADLRFSSKMSVLLGKHCVRLSLSQAPSKKQAIFCSEKKEKAKKKKVKIAIRS